MDSGELLSKAFPFMVAMDRDMRICLAGPSMAKVAGDVAGLSFTDVFRLDSPRVAPRMDELERQSFSVFYATLARDPNPLPFKGQMLPLGDGRIAFLCSPSITRLTDLSVNGISLNDFSPSDSTVDFVIHLQTKQAALDEARDARSRMGEELVARRIAEESLERLNRELDERVRERSDGLAHALDDLRRENSERAAAEERARLSARRLAETVGDLERRNSQMRVLNRMGDMLQSCSGIRDVHSVVSDTMRLLFPEDSGFLALSREDAPGELAVAVTWGSGAVGSRTLTKEDCWGLRRGRMHTRQPGERKAVCRHLRGAGFDNTVGGVCIPLVSQGMQVGLLHLMLGSWASGPPERALSEMDARNELLHNVSETIGLAVANLRMSERLRQMSIRDPLTGLYNRRYMEDSLAREIARSKRHGKPVSVMMMDLDRFKSYNDRWGHHGGDALLRLFASTVAGRLRGEDVVCRYGGEEFIAILPGATAQDAAAKADRIRQAVALAVPVSEDGTPMVPATVSVGVASFPESADDIPGMLRAADGALYDSKVAGRDRVTVAPPAGPAKSEGTEDGTLDGAVDRNV